jgi:hypothetical protein
VSSSRRLYISPKPTPRRCPIETRELAETIVFEVPRLTAKQEPGGWSALRNALIQRSDTPKADDLADRFENVDELLLCIVRTRYTSPVLYGKFSGWRGR